MNTFSLFSYFFSPFFAVYLHHSPLAFLFSSHPLNSVRVLGYHTLFLCSLDFITSPPRGSSFLLLHFRSIRLPRFDVYYSNEIIILFSRRRIFSILIKRRSLSPRYVSAYIYILSLGFYLSLSPPLSLVANLAVSRRSRIVLAANIGPRYTAHSMEVGLLSREIKASRDDYYREQDFLFSRLADRTLLLTRCVKKNDNRGGYLSSSKKRERRDTIDFRARIKHIYIYVFIVEFLKKRLI